MKTVTTPLAEITKIISGTTPESMISKYWKGQILWITPTDLGKNRELYLSNSERKITEEGRKSCNLKKVPKGAVVMSSRAPIGHLAIAGCELYTNQGCKSFVPINNVLDSEFLYFLLKHRMPDIKAIGSGATFLEVSKTALNNFIITFPENLADQRNIISKLKAQLAEVESARKALELQLSDIVQLERFYLNQFENTLFANAIKKPFSDFVQSYKNGFGTRPKEGEAGAIVLRIADVSQGKVDLSSTRQGAISAKEAEVYKLESGDLLFIRVNGAKHIVGKCILIDQIPDGTIFNDHLIRVRLKDLILSDYAQLCALLPNTRQMIEEAASTSAGQLTVNQKILDQIVIPFIDKDAQHKMVSDYGLVLSEIKALRNGVKTQLKDLSLIPARLLTQAFTSIT